MDRRSFLATAASLAVGSVFVASCGDGQIGGALGPLEPPGGPGGLLIQIADFPALSAVGGSARVDAGGSNPVAVTRTGANSFVALSMICPHAGYKPIQITAPGFKCPNHGAEFEPDGNWVGGQHTRDLSAFVVEYDAAAGTLLIT